MPLRSHRLLRTRAAVGLAAGLAGAGLLTACATSSSSRGPEPAAAVAAKVRPYVVVAVGDIACPPKAPTRPKSCQQNATAELTADLEPDAVLALGDQQYERGSLKDFRNSYDTSWGDLRHLTYPVPGNHEYKTAGARGYYRYFRHRQPGAPGYYAVNLGGWRVYALNSNCGEIACGKQYRWLRRDLAKRPHDCSLFTMHHPRFSSGSHHGSSVAMSRFFTIAQRHDVEMVLAGHDHDYERFRRMTADGTVSPNGVLSFVSGAGGKSAYPFGKVVPGSAYRNTGTFGVLRLALRPHRFNFSFREIDGSVPDRGRRACR